MKKTTFLGLALLALIPAISFAGVCEDLKASYLSRIVTLTNEFEAAKLQTSNPDEVTALTLQYNMEKDALVKEMDTALVGCTSDTGGTTGGTGGDGSGTTGGDGSGVGSGDDGGTDSTVCAQKIEAFEADVESKKGTMSKSALVQYMNTKKAEIKECIKWGKVRSKVNPL